MRSLLVVSLACVAASTLGAQQQPPVFRADTTIIPIDIAVLDKDRKPVSDLKQADFTVYENNVKQEIRAFFTTELKPDPPSPDANPTLIRTADAPASLAPRTRRTFLFVFAWTKEGDRHVATLDVQVLAGDIKEKVIGSEDRRLDISVDDETYQRYLTGGIPYSAGVPFIGDAVYVKVLVYDFGADLWGTTYVKLR